MKDFCIVMILSFVTGCSAGKHSDQHNKGLQINKQIEMKVSSSRVLTKKIIFNEKSRLSLFSHPGLIFGIDWGGSRAYDAGLELIKAGYYKNIIIIRSRKGSPIYHQMMTDGNTSYLGIHYSLGGAPEVLKEAVKATEKASYKLNKNLVYNAILVDPYGYSNLLDYIDIDSQSVGTIFVIVSSDYSFLRPSMENIPTSLLNHKKIHYIYPDEFGLTWDHFGFLSAVKDIGEKNANALKIKDIFYLLVNAIHFQANSIEIESGLQDLRDEFKKTRYYVGKSD